MDPNINPPTPRPPLIRVVDARMGRGKTSAAEAYMESHPDRRFLYVTPYLTEVSRICEACDIDQPDLDNQTKLSQLKMFLSRNRSVSTTHALFYLLDGECLDILRDNKYTLIIDESIEMISKVYITRKDFEVMLDSFADVDKNNFVHWRDPEYFGKFSIYKDIADSGSLYCIDEALLSIMNPIMLSCFEEIIMMTYMFNGQCQRGYLDYYGFEYKICGIDNTSGFKFTDNPDNPPPVNFKDLIHIIDERKLNEIGRGKFALSKKWYDSRSSDNTEIRQLRNNLNTFFRRRYPESAGKRVWTCYKDGRNKIEGKDNLYHNSFLQHNARATNEYRNRDTVAYLVNRFLDPNVSKFLSQQGVKIDQDQFALSEMLQFIWRSAIRDGKPINVYIPSKRMRDLLIDWIESNSKGGAVVE